MLIGTRAAVPEPSTAIADWLAADELNVPDTLARLGQGGSGTANERLKKTKETLDELTERFRQAANRTT